MRIVVTGSAGLVGSEVVSYFSSFADLIVGIDNNMRRDFFGPAGDTSWNRQRLIEGYSVYRHVDIDVRDRGAVRATISRYRPDLIVHAAAQPSHDLAARRPFDDFEVNALGTLNLLEAVRDTTPDAIFIYMSTNKVYGAAPNELAMEEKETRWDYADPAFWRGINEEMRIDRSLHSIFGASKVAADILVQEYGLYFELRTCCLRGGCLTGPTHSAVELHGFLSHLVRTNLTGGTYTVFGYKGKQVRDNIHALDVARLIHEFVDNPRLGAVYNVGGGRDNACSVLEAFALVSDMTRKKMSWRYIDTPRRGDHMCYITDLSKAEHDHPKWSVSRSLPEILDELVTSWRYRLKDC